jgi:hypothetical protein
MIVILPYFVLSDCQMREVRMWALSLAPGPPASSQGAAAVQTLYYVTTFSAKHNSTMCAVQSSLHR